MPHVIEPCVPTARQVRDNLDFDHKYPRLRLLANQRFIESKAIPTDEVTAIIDVTGDPPIVRKAEKKPMSKWIGNKTIKIRFFLISVVFLTTALTMLGTGFRPLSVPIALFSIGALAAGVVWYCWSPEKEDPRAYLNGTYDMQLKWDNRKAVYVQNTSNGIIIKYITRTGPLVPGRDAGDCTIM